MIELAGGIWWEKDPATPILDITACVMDGNIMSSIGWPAHASYLGLLLRSMGAQISSARISSVLFLCGVSKSFF